MDHTWRSRGNLEQGTSGILVPRGPATLPSWGRMVPDSAFNRQCHLMPLENQLEVGSGLLGKG